MTANTANNSDIKGNPFELAIWWCVCGIFCLQSITQASLMACFETIREDKIYVIR